MSEPRDDIVKRLRLMNIGLSHEAADEIERLRSVLRYVRDEMEHPDCAHDWSSTAVLKRVRDTIRDDA